MRYNKNHTLPRKLYQQTRWQISRYYEIKEQYEAAVQKAKVLDGMPRGSNVSDPTSAEALVRIKYGEQLSAIEKALEKIEPYYRKGLIDYLALGKPFPLEASIRTWKNNLHELVYWTARYNNDI